MSDRPVSLIIGDAVREVAECHERLCEVVSKAEQALEQSKTERTEAAKLLTGLQKLHRQATAATRKREQPALERAKRGIGMRPKDLINDLLTSSLTTLDKVEIRKRTGLSSTAVGVILGKGLKAGEYTEKDGQYGIAQAISRELRAV